MIPLVLVVDDSITMREMLAHVLQLAGYEVVEAPDAERALEIARARPVGAVITDHNLPGMNGIELVRNLRAMRNHAATPILVLTTERSDSLREAGREARASGWMVKPFDPQRLVEIVRRLLA